MTTLDLIVCRCEHASQRSLNAENGEVIAGHELARDAFSASAVVQTHLRLAETKHSAEDLVMVTEILIHGVGDPICSLVAAIVTPDGAEHDQLLRVFHWKHAHQDLISKREHGGVGADSKRKRQDGDNYEERCSLESAQGKRYVLQKVHNEDFFRLEELDERMDQRLGNVITFSYGSRSGR